MELFYPLGLLGLLAIPLWYLFFLFQQRRLEREFPSLMIWQKTQSRVKNFPTQSWKWFDLLLLIPFLTILLLSLGASTPVAYYRGEKEITLGILLDRTASMGVPHSRGQRRWDQALIELKKLLDSLKEEDRILLFIHPSQSYESPRPLSPRDTWAKAKALSPTLQGGSPLPAFLLIKNRFNRVDGWFLFTDDLQDQRKGREIISLGEERDNGAITHLSGRKIPGKREVELLIQVTNFSGSKKKMELEVALGEKKDRIPLTLGPFEKKNLFPKIAESRRVVSLRLLPEDPFPLDNRGWIGVSPLSRRSVYYGMDTQSPLYYALKASGKVHFTSLKDRASLAISSGEPLSTTTPVVLYFRAPSKKSSPGVKIHSTPELSNLFPGFPPLSFEGSSFSTVKKEAHLTALFKGPGGEWAGAHGKKGDQEIWIFGFAIDEKMDWTRRVTFPYFWNRFVERLETQFPFSYQVFRVFHSYSLPLPEGDGRLVSPSGKEVTLTTSTFDPQEVGIYSFSQGFDAFSLPVNFLSSESNLYGKAKAFRRESLPKRSQKTIRELPLKRYFLLISLFGILLYWRFRKSKGRM